MVENKLCPKCDQIKSADQFYAQAKRPDGLSSYCRKCQVADAKSRYTAHPRWKAPAGTKWCPGCESIKPLDEFGANRSTEDGKQSRCKPCCVASVTASRHKDPTSHRRSSKAWRETNVDRHADNNARWKYGLEHGTYAQMFAAQNGKCAICGTTDPGPRLKRFPIDHCHGSNIVRGLLCGRCNQGIGLFDDDPVKMKAAASYLEETAAVIATKLK